MNSREQEYIVDEKGNRIGVLLDYRPMRKELEELQSMRAYGSAKASKDEAIPFEQAFKDIARERK